MKIKVKITTQSNMNYFNCESGSIVEVDLEDYVACVVASEIGNATLEACKAQAVVSRTFAVSRGVLEGKAISDDAAKAQAYIASRNNYENCNKATKETCGQILYYGNEVCTTYYCHSNGGRTYACEEVWTQKKPYLVARDDIWTLASGEKKSGHGIGLSQVGAKWAGSKGIGYQEMLDFYYPYTEIIKLGEKQKEDDYNRKIIKEVKVRVELALKEIEGML